LPVKMPEYGRGPLTQTGGTRPYSQQTNVINSSHTGHRDTALLRILRGKNRQNDRCYASSALRARHAE
jgi:hypothetical protein